MPDILHQPEHYSTPRRAWYNGQPVQVVEYNPPNVTIELPSGEQITVPADEVELH
jgi:hypothetical protein